MNPEAARWLAIAEQDIKAVRNSLRGPEPTIEIAAYHCQQAAEKIVKACLIAAGIDPPRHALPDPPSGDEMEVWLRTIPAAKASIERFIK